MIGRARVALADVSIFFTLSLPAAVLKSFLFVL
jgi:hypothetical protein